MKNKKVSVACLHTYLLYFSTYNKLVRLSHRDGAVQIFLLVNK